MSRLKKDPEPDSDTASPGEVLPPVEDFIRKMSSRFSSEFVVPDSPADVDDGEESEEGEEE